MSRVCLCPLQVGGLVALIIGMCALVDNKHSALMSQLPILPALLLTAVGTVGLCVGFIGLLGAVRESFCLLKMVKNLLVFWHGLVHFSLVFSISC